MSKTTHPVRISARGSGEVLVLLHGIAASMSIWDEVIPGLAAHRRVVSVDLPGFGNSPPVGRGFKLSAVAEAVLAAVESEANGAPFDIVGHSLGAVVATAIALKAPELTRRLVLLAPAGLGSPLPLVSFPGLPGISPRSSLLGVTGSVYEAAMRARAFLLPLTAIPHARRALLPFAAADSSRLSADQAWTLVADAARARRTAAAISALASTNLATSLSQLDVPLNIIWGRADRTVPATLARRLKRARPGLEVSYIDGVGHVPMLESPQVFTDLVLKLLNAA